MKNLNGIILKTLFLYKIIHLSTKIIVHQGKLFKSNQAKLCNFSKIYYKAVKINALNKIEKNLRVLHIHRVRHFVQSLKQSNKKSINAQRKNIEEVVGVDSVKEKRLSETSNSDVENIIKGLEEVKFKLKQEIEKDSSNGYIIDEIRDIQCIVDQARKIGENKSEPLLERINKVLDTVDLAIKKVNNFHKNYTELLPNTIFNDLKNVLDKCKDELDNFKEKLEFIKKSITPITELYNTRKKFYKNDNKQVYEAWAIALEKFGEGLEDFLDIYPEFIVDEIESSIKQILFDTASKTRENNRKESYRRRLRYAANFVINLIESKKRYLSHEEIYEISDDQDKLIEDLMILSESGLDELWLAPGEEEAWKNLLDT